MVNHSAEFKKLLETFRYKYHTFSVFSDFLTLASISLRQQVVWSDEDEKLYLNTIKKYEKKDYDKFPKMLAHTVQGLRERHHDFLGEIFMGLELGNAYHGQFFTPYTVASLCSSFTLQDIDTGKKLVTLSDPCVGAGCMLIAAHETYLSLKADPKPPIYFNAIDLDLRCVQMSYIQFSALGIPAHVTHGNSLSMEMFKSYPTSALIPLIPILEEEGIIKKPVQPECSNEDDKEEPCKKQSA
jgi:type I restriction-modification system DNA methylase subunit